MVEKIGYGKAINPAKLAAIKKAGSADAAAFADALSHAESAIASDGAHAAEGASPTAAMTGAGSLVGLQEMSAEEVERRRGFKKGRLTLDALIQLRDAMLIGTLPLGVLRNLERLVAQERALITDPRLQSILDEIDVRAAVEIAKLEMSGVL